MRAKFHNNGERPIAVIPVHFRADNRACVIVARPVHSVLAHLAHFADDSLKIGRIRALFVPVPVRVQVNPSERMAGYHGLRSHLQE